MSDATDLSQAERVINKFGGVNATARACGHKSASTVQGWKERGWIPQERHHEVLEAARRMGIPLSAEDFIEHLRRAEQSVVEGSAGGRTPEVDAA